ncbi:MAG: OmpA family protein [Bacteroidales bacterium]|nr:OmpA family protein [Bacteroidales bacterium]MDT8373990.1 OmpA family protein [Bacteroidales bacterium]
MKQPVLFLSVLLILWITGASYWYVCRIRCDCKAAPTSMPVEELQASADANAAAAVDTTSLTAEQELMASVEEAKTFISGTGVQKGFFPSSSAEGDMSGVSEEFLKKLKLCLDNTPSAKIEVTGHADITGPEPFNRTLGLERAGFVKSFLVSAGINAEQIVISSMGSSEPAAPNNTPEGRAANRRTEIKVII